MRCVLVTCNGYKIVREVVVNDVSELPSLCRSEEIAANDGYAVYASHYGEIVANADGPAEPDSTDRAYQAGYAYACGYHD